MADLWLARWLADQDNSDELRQRADRGDYSALRALVWRLARRDMGDELRELAVAADAERRLLILDMAKEAGSSGIEVPRARVALGDDSARGVLAHWLVREGRLDELREPADRGDEYARCLLAESQGEP